MTTFLCDEPSCPNADIEYNFEDSLATAQCGGCGAILRPVD